MSGLRRKTGKNFLHDFQEFAKDEELTKTTEAVAEMANSLNHGVLVRRTVRLLDRVPEEPTNAEVLELQWEPELKRQEKRELQEKTPKKIHSDRPSGSFCRTQQAP